MIPARSIRSFVLVLTMLPMQTMAARTGIEIDLESCHPDGALASTKEDWNPREFWERQYALLGTTLDQENLAGLQADCRTSLKGSQWALNRCLQTYQSRHDAALRCRQHAQAQCRHYGGQCNR